jgi:outer membrane receptor protein involved in Fe transport
MKSYFVKEALIIRIFLINAALLTVTIASSQSKIRGRVADETGKPMPSANVLLLNLKDSSLIKGMVTDAEGAYVFNKVATGRYLITSSYSGFSRHYTSPLDIPSTNSEINAGIAKLMKTNTVLDKVTVSITKPFLEQKIDRMIVNVKNSITSSGSTALDVLERSPGVIVNRQNNNLSMNGKDGVVVMINGKINRLPVEAVVQMLSGMSSANIERIELITTPPANYDAEGNAGFINIVMVENPNFGTNGSYSITGGVGRGNTTSGSINFNHRKGKVNLYGDYSISRQQQKQMFAFYRKIRYNGDVIETSSESDRDPIQFNQNARLGLDFQASKNTVIGGLLAFYNNRWSMNASSDQNIVINNKLDTFINIQNEEINFWKHRSANLNMVHNFSQDEKLTLNADYLYYTNSNPNTYDNAYYTGGGSKLFANKTRSGKITPINVHVESADYTKKLSSKTNLQLGAKSSISRFTNDISLDRLINNKWISDPALTASYNLKEDIVAAYGSVDYAASEKTNLKLGLRYEYTRSNLETATEKNIVDRKYGQFFPTLFISRKINQNNSVNFAYTRRISRPTFNQLAPFLYFFDPNSFVQGNPALQPAISNTIKTDYTFKRYIFSLSYSHDENTIIRFQPKIDSVSNKQIITGTNLKSLNTLSGSFSLPFTINSWWNMQNNIMANWQQVNTSYNDQPVKLEQANFRLTSTQTFKLPKNYSIELFAFYQSKSLGGYSVGQPFGTVNLGAQKKFDKGSLRLNVTNMFETLRFRFYSDIPSQNLNTSGELVFAQRTFSLTYSRNFGNDKLKAKRSVTGAEEERKRVE